MMQPVIVQRVDQRLEDMFLSHQLGKRARPPFAGQYLITHASKLIKCATCVEAPIISTAQSRGKRRPGREAEPERRGKLGWWPQSAPTPHTTLPLPRSG